MSDIYDILEIRVEEGYNSVRIWFRYFFSGPKMGSREVFAESLPGLPDNIRMSTDRKNFYVALFALRFHGNPYFLDYMAPRSWLRMTLAKAGFRAFSTRFPL